MIYAQILIAKYGEKHQILKAVEELTELSLSLQHFLQDKVTKDIVESEFVDVTVMMEQLKIIFDFSDETLETIKNHKLAKLKL